MIQKGDRFNINCECVLDGIILSAQRTIEIYAYVRGVSIFDYIYMGKLYTSGKTSLNNLIATKHIIPMTSVNSIQSQKTSLFKRVHIPDILEPTIAQPSFKPPLKNDIECNHSDTYLNVISASLQFRVCRKCKKEVK